MKLKACTKPLLKEANLENNYSGNVLRRCHWFKIVNFSIKYILNCCICSRLTYQVSFKVFFFTNRYIFEKLLCLQLPQNVTWTDKIRHATTHKWGKIDPVYLFSEKYGDLSFLYCLFFETVLGREHQGKGLFFKSLSLVSVIFSERIVSRLATSRPYFFRDGEREKYC